MITENTAVFTIHDKFIYFNYAIGYTPNTLLEILPLVLFRQLWVYFFLFY